MDRQVRPAQDVEERRPQRPGAGAVGQLGDAPDDVVASGRPGEGPAVRHRRGELDLIDERGGHDRRVALVAEPDQVAAQPIRDLTRAPVRGPVADRHDPDIGGERRCAVRLDIEHDQLGVGVPVLQVELDAPDLRPLEPARELLLEVDGHAGHGDPAVPGERAGVCDEGRGAHAAPEVVKRDDHRILLVRRVGAFAVVHVC